MFGRKQTHLQMISWYESDLVIMVFAVVLVSESVVNTNGRQASRNTNTVNVDSGNL